ncbi:MAG: type IX secretion system membrane protein PorP/SprF [Prolixibacteraceae bacterium]|nr:type IX secretion system membrane protein PorP/SprF [Prolixibacteraceae bacterium]MBN2775498.1 type IX secretion system membrane protein PorP/SprF [Prolixibacteraceae bacterium]
MKKKLKYSLILLIILLGLNWHSNAQLDPMFTQYMFNTQSINPAYAGMWEKIGFFSLVRRNFAGIDRAPLTQLISFHTPVKNEFVGVGLNIINDNIGRETRLSIFGDYSFKVLLKRDLYLRLGLKFGFLNYNNRLSEYELYPDNQFDPAFQGEINNKFMPNFGVGAFLYNDYFYVSLSIPKLIQNDFAANVNNFSSLAEAQHVYLTAGYIFGMPKSIKFKPSVLFRYTLGLPLQFDLAGTFNFKERFELGAMLRTGSSIGFIAQWIFNKKLRVGYAVDVPITEIFNYQYGCHEVMVSYDIDFYGRSYVRSRFF